MNYQYRVGGSLAYNHPTYIERNADRELLTALKNGQFCYVFNCRQMGKSSLRVRVTHILQQLGMDCASVDITSLGSNDNLSQWYNGVITRLFLGFNLTGKINLKSWLREREDLPPVQRLGQFIEEVLLVYCRGEKIYIFIDEIDKILSLQFSLDDFFSLIRYCYNQRAENAQYERITFALFGVATPADLIREKTQTSFNIGQAIELTGFNLTEIAPLAAGLSSQSNYQPDCLEKIIFWTGGQPFLTQKICQLLRETNLDIETLIKERIINNWESHDEPVHLRTIADRLLRNQDKAGRLLGIYQQILEKGAILCDDSPEQGELRLSGLVVKKDNQLVVYNAIYREIFNLNWLEKQLEQLRQQKGLIEAVYAFEIQFPILLATLSDSAKITPRLQVYSTYPGAARDIAFFVSTDIPVDRLTKTIKNAGGTLLEKVELFDRYQGQNVPENHCSLAFSLVYRASDRTLTDEDVEPLMTKVREALVKQFQVSLRS